MPQIIPIKDLKNKEAESAKRDSGYHIFKK